MLTQRNDFVELEFVGKANGDVFDTNIQEEAEKLKIQIENKPLIICIGHEMVVKTFDTSLESKEVGKQYSVKILPGTDFGERKRELVRTIPMRLFSEKNIAPKPGMTLALDNNLTKIIAVSGGRVIVDFNNPLAGKEVVYEFKIKRKITDEKEKIDSLQDFFFRQRFKFRIDSGKVIFEKKAEPFLTIFKDKFKEILSIEIETEPEKKPEKEPEKKPQETKE